MSWTDERVELLKRLWSEGLSASQIAGRLGSVTRNAVIGKVHRLGLSGRATTSRMKTHRPRTRMANAVWAVEAAQREVMQPEKVNLATLGNMTPHVHWHVIPRFLDDRHFPSPVWAEPRRSADVASLAARRALLPQLREAVRRQLDAAGLTA